MDNSEQRMKRRGQPAVCPFCGDKIARPIQQKNPFNATSYTGGHCFCGAIFLFDATGRQGGELLMEGLFLICRGDMDQAIKLRAGVDYELHSVGYSPRVHAFEPQTRIRSMGRPKLWFFKLSPSFGPVPTQV